MIMDFIGLRALKTGIAVFISLLIANFVPHSLPLLAGVAAIMCLQPSITAGVQKGVVRVKATLLGGMIGLLFPYIIGTSPLAMGIGTVIMIIICRKLKWSDGMTLAVVTMIAIMSQSSGGAIMYALGRMISTWIGIGAATVINIIIAPPRHQKTFRMELKRLTASFPGLYHSLVEACTASDCDLIARAEEQLITAEEGVANLRREFTYLKEGMQDRYGPLLEGIDLREYLLFERGIHFLDGVMRRMQDIVEVGRRRCEWRETLLLRGEIKHTSPTPEFLILSTKLKELAALLSELHRYVFRVVGEQEFDFMPKIKSQAEEIRHLKNGVRQSLRKWEMEHGKRLDAFSVMSLYRIVFDLEEIANSLRRLSETAVSIQENGTKLIVQDKTTQAMKGEG